MMNEAEWVEFLRTQALYIRSGGTFYIRIGVNNLRIFRAYIQPSPLTYSICESNIQSGYETPEQLPIKRLYLFCEDLISDEFWPPNIDIYEKADILNEAVVVDISGNSIAPLRFLLDYLI